MADDDALLDLVSSANVACGFLAGDPSTMRRVCERAVVGGVAIGAHVGYRDLAGFGRRRIEVDADELAEEVGYQIGALAAFARIAFDRVRYVKPHGTLYNTVVTDAGQAAAVVEAVRRQDPALPVLGAARVGVTAAGRRGRPPRRGGGVRAYTADGHLVPRQQRGAILHDVEAIRGPLPAPGH